MTHKKNSAPDSKKLLKDNISRVRLYFVGVIIVIGFGIAMFISPSAPAHNSVERVSVAFIKDIWGVPGGIFLLALSLITSFIIYRKLLSFKELISIKHDGYLYTYFKKESIKDIGVVFHGEELLGFDISSHLVYTYPKYKKQLDDFVYAVDIHKGFQCDTLYWKYIDNTFHFYENGKLLTHATIEVENKDVMVTIAEKTSRIMDYQKYEDGLLREVKFL